MIKTTTMLRRSLLAILCGLVVTTTGVAPMTAMTVHAEPTDEGDDGDDEGDDDDDPSDMPENTDDSLADEIHVRYAVQIYGIKEDVAARDADGTDAQTAGLTFGPAIGDNYIGTDEDGEPKGRSHTLEAGKTSALGYALRCVHDDSWEMICYWNELDPTVYQDCVDYGCTKSVVLTRDRSTNAGDSSDRVFYYAEDGGTQDARTKRVWVKGDGPSVLYSELQDDARIWANQHDSGLSWATSRIRAALNGVQDETTDEYGGTEYTGKNCVFYALPEALQEHIGYKENSYQYNYVVDDDGNATTSSGTCYDRLWLVATTEMYAEDDLGDYIRGVFELDGENTRYSRNDQLTPDYDESRRDDIKWYQSATGYKVDVSKTWLGKDTAGSTGTKANYWLRSMVKSTFISTDEHSQSAEPQDERYSYAANVASYGLNNADTHWTYSGIAFGFTLYRETQDPEDPDPTPGTSTPASTPSEEHGENEGVGSITLYNTDTTVSKYLAGAQFALYKSNGDYVGTYTMDANGYLNIKGVDASTYYFVQLTAPEGYVLDPTYLRFQLKGNQDLALVFKNALVGTVATNTDGTLADTVASPNADGTQAVADGADADAAFSVNSDGTNAGTGNANANGDLNGNGVGATGDDSLMTTYGVVAGAAAILLMIWFVMRKRRAGQ